MDKNATYAYDVQTAWDIAQAVERQGIDVVGLSFSEAVRLNVAYEMLEDLRGRLPDARGPP